MTLPYNSTDMHFIKINAWAVLLNVKFKVVRVQCAHCLHSCSEIAYQNEQHTAISVHIPRTVICSRTIVQSRLLWPVHLLSSGQIFDKNLDTTLSEFLTAEKNEVGKPIVL